MTAFYRRSFFKLRERKTCGFPLTGSPFPQWSRSSESKLPLRDVVYCMRVSGRSNVLLYTFSNATQGLPFDRLRAGFLRIMLPKAYDPSHTEDRIYKMWEESGAFKADNKSEKEAFAISMPPPNATGQLHLGHAVMLALEDIFIRFERMRGKEALWVPGTDHAAIATESVVIKKIQKEEKIADPRASLGRKALVARIAESVEKSQGTIRSQIRKMGSSCDWSRERYTMDPSLNRCVNEVFKKMYSDGLIYRGYRVVNWDIALQTTISDDEIEYKDTEAVMYTIEYLTAQQTGGDPVYVSTSRPETKLGDTALAVHPDDKRYAHLVGRDFTVEWPGGQVIAVTVIGDHSVDPAVGAGVVGITPFHSKIDYEIWQRHKEEIEATPMQVIGENGNILSSVKGYGGLSIQEGREQFVGALRSAGRIRSEEAYVQPLSVSYRSKMPVEPLPKLQWFIDVNGKGVKWNKKKMSLKEVMQDVIRKGDIKIIPDRFEKTYFHWIDNLQDWCISRQIWWGHRVPVFYCPKCRNEQGVSGSGKRLAVSPSTGLRTGGQHVSVQPLSVCPDCGGPVEQDPDTLDTWFSSALWTWSTLVDEKLTEDFSLSLEEILEKSPDFQKFHPTQVMETGYDILFFWVARMILMTTYATGQIPFKTVYLHGLIRTREGKKMSKSDPETCIDPLEIIPKYGADALRLSMIVGQSPGNDSRLFEEKIAGYRNFINKLWNASRFVLMKCEEAGVDPHKAIVTYESPDELSLADRALLHALDFLRDDVTEGLEAYRLSEVGERLYSFVWDYFCDWYLELSKGEANLALLVQAMRIILQLLHPYCPFVTEELWSHFKYKDAEMLLKMPWPGENKKTKKFADAYKQLQLVIDVISSIRKMRAEQDIELGMKIAVAIHTKHVDLLEKEREHILRMGRVEKLTIDDQPKQHTHAASTFLHGTEVHMPLEGIIDLEKVREKLTKEQKNLEDFLKGVRSKLGNKKFVANAPEEVVQIEREKLESAQEKLEKVEERLKALA